MHMPTPVMSPSIRISACCLWFCLVLFPMGAEAGQGAAIGGSGCVAENLFPATGRATGWNGLAIDYAIEGLAISEFTESSHKLAGYPTGAQVSVSFKVSGPYSIELRWETNGGVVLNGETVESFRAPDQGGAQGWTQSLKPVVVTITDAIRRNGFHISANVGYARSSNAEIVFVDVVGKGCDSPTAVPPPGSSDSSSGASPPAPDVVSHSSSGVDWSTLPPFGLGRVGYLPGPKSAMEAIIGVLAPGLIAILGGLLSGVFANPLPSGAAPDATPLVPSPDPVDGASPPSDIEYTYPDGRHTVLVYSPEHGGYINELTGGLVDAASLEAWKKSNEDIQRGLDEYRKHNADLVAAHQDAQSQALQALKDQQAAKDAELKRQAAMTAAQIHQVELVNAQQQTEADYWKDVKEGFWEANVHDYDDLPNQLRKAAKSGLIAAGTAVGTVGAAVGAVVSEVSNGDFWRAVRDGGLQTIDDLALHPLQSAGKVAGFYEKVGESGVKAIGGAAIHVVTHPLDTVKSAIGSDNWEKAMDPNTTALERIGRTLFGTFDMGMNIVGVGEAIKGLKAAGAALETSTAVVRSADKVLGAAKAADGVGDVAKVTRAVDEAKGASAAERAAEQKRKAAAYFANTPEQRAIRERAWNDAQKAGKTKVDVFEAAKQEAHTARMSGDEAAEVAANEKLRKAALEVQGDKQSLWEINKRGDDLKRSFNKEMGEVYKKTDDGVVKDICAERGWDPKNLYEQPAGSGNWFNRETGRPDIVIVKPTNAKPGITVGADRDVTVRVREYGNQMVADPNTPGGFINAGGQGVLTDVPSDDLACIYNRRFYEASGAERHYPDLDPDGFDLAHKLDQVATDRLHAEAYGRGQKDLGVAIRKPGEDFSDAAQVAKAAQYKSDHLYDQAHKLAADGKYAEAETAMREGMRQSTKQFDNQVMKRAQALAEQGVDVRIPEKLRIDMNIMKMGQEGWSPAKIAEELAKRDTSIEDVTQRSAGFLESMQKFKPKS